MSHATHVNAALTPRARLRLARLIVEDGWPIARAAERYDVSWPTAKRWAERYRRLGEAGMNDASSRPHHSPRATPQPVVRKIVHLRWKQRLGPVQIADQVSLAPSTVHKVLVRCRINRLTHVDRATGEPIRRYEHDHPGSLLHQDVKKLGNIPDGGGWRYVGKHQGAHNRQATRDRTGIKARKYHPKVGTCFVHTVIDDYTRLAYAECHDDETAATAAAVLTRAVVWFAVRGVSVERVLTDNGGCYRSFLWRDTCTDLGITPKRTRPYRPQTNGKIERFHRTLAHGWAFKKLYRSENARRAALAGWLHEYNHHRPHTAIGGSAPITRLTNLTDQYS
ncbi:IS481 family transposase [Nocardioides sp. MAH-18]|uniref:IS481 family transposase n=1 Tax=Nocardioides agri TaxID=2682843 RepID=A0A6L6XQB2_9ACTN|nr:IS481 family transposase [Nocardioides sp. CGMCC 1.13656]MBA2954469.1 IS481 family transposase [Nocardioides sp. CGMCC 1.13656]MVQ49330.1 IS481 family transposase [Nocardioides sp. MAH-18]